MSIVEKMEAAYRQMVCARPVGAGDSNTYTVEPPTRERFRKAVITATGLTEAQLEGLANGTMVCVPVSNMSFCCQEDGDACGPFMDQEREIAELRAMLAAKEG